MAVSEPLLMTFLKRTNTSQSVELTLGLVLTLLMVSVILSGIRSGMDDTGWPIAVCVLNVLSFAVLVVDAWFFSLQNFLSLLVLIFFESVSTLGNIVMCFVGDLYMRAVSAIMLIFSFSAKGVLIAYVLSTIIRMVSDMHSTDQ